MVVDYIDVIDTYAITQLHTITALFLSLNTNMLYFHENLLYWKHFGVQKGSYVRNIFVLHSSYLI